MSATGWIMGFLAAAGLYLSFRPAKSETEVPETAFPQKVVGVTYKNSDGKSRQKIISRLSPGDTVELIPEPENKYDPYAVAVVSQYGQIGYLPENPQADIFNALIDGRDVQSGIYDIVGGEKGKENLGVVLWVDKGIKSK